MAYVRDDVALVLLRAQRAELHEVREEIRIKNDDDSTEMEGLRRKEEELANCIDYIEQTSPLLRS